MTTNFDAKPGTVAYTRVEMTQFVLPQFANALGTVFGGQIMAWVDICAAVSAQRHCRGQVVTASIDGVNFISPVKQGHIVILRSHVTAVFNTSMEIAVTVTAENPLTGDRHLSAKAHCTFVCLDEYARPRKLPKLVLEGAEEKKENAEAVERRRVRLEARQKESAQL